MQASKLNRRITLYSQSFTQNNTGSIAATLAETFDTWAEVIPTGGGTSINQAQMMSNGSYQVTIRYRPGVTTNWNVIYDGMTLIINNIQVDNEAYKMYLVLTCSTGISQTSWS